MTDGMKYWIVITLCVIVFGTAAVLWAIYIPPDIRTPEQRRLDAYYNCVSEVITDRGDVNNCNNIH